MYNVTQSYSPTHSEVEILLLKKFENLQDFKNYFKKEELYHGKINIEASNIDNEENNIPNQNKEEDFDVIIGPAKVYGEENYLKKRTAKEVVREEDNFYTINMTYLLCSIYVIFLIRNIIINLIDDPSIEEKNSVKTKYLTTFEEFLKIMHSNLPLRDFLTQNVSVEQNNDNNHSHRLKIVLITPDVEITDSIKRIKSSNEGKFFGFQPFEIVLDKYKFLIE